MYQRTTTPSCYLTIPTFWPVRTLCNDYGEVAFVLGVRRASIERAGTTLYSTHSENAPPSSGAWRDTNQAYCLASRTNRIPPPFRLNARLKLLGLERQISQSRNFIVVSNGGAAGKCTWEAREHRHCAWGSKPAKKVTQSD